FGVLITSFLHIASIKQQKKINVGFRFFVLPYGIFILTSIVQPIITVGLPLIVSCSITIGMVLLLLFLTRQIRFTDFQYLRSIFSRS
ncbi:MAG: hypothetical protein ABS884_09545, partial [Solibacillus isronensis]